MMACGELQKVPVDTILVPERSPTDALYILLDGTISLSITEDERNSLASAFAAMKGNEISAREVARLSKGEIMGET